MKEFLKNGCELVDTGGCDQGVSVLEDGSELSLHGEIQKCTHSVIITVDKRNIY